MNCLIKNGVQPIKQLYAAIIDGKNRCNITVGSTVQVVLKKDQSTGSTHEGVVKDILTKSKFHPHGIKVRLQDGSVGRVKTILYTLGIKE